MRGRVVHETNGKYVTRERERDIVEGWTFLVNVWSKIYDLAKVRVESMLKENMNTFARM